MTGPRQPGADLTLALTPFPPPNPFVVAWRWRYELLAVASTAELVRHLGLLWTVYTGLALVVAVGAVGPARRRAVQRFWCVVTPHRVRTGCKHAWIHSRTGRIPAVLWTRAVLEGEQVLLWCRAGTTVGDLAAAGPVLTAACWAHDVRVEQHPTRAHLARVTVLRRQGQPGTAA